MYCLLFGSYPFNAFLSGMISCIGTFVLTGKPPVTYIILLSDPLLAVSLRIQISPQNRNHKDGFATAPSRVVAQYLLCVALLQLSF